MTENGNPVSRSIREEWVPPDGSSSRTILGHGKIEGDRLTVEVNSAARAKQCKALLKKRLKSAVKLVSETSQDWREVAQEAAKNAAPQPASLTAHKALKGMIERMSREWVDQPVPSLKGETPRQAVTTPGGRERIEALLCAMDRHCADGGKGADPDVIRRELGWTMMRT